MYLSMPHSIANLGTSLHLQNKKLDIVLPGLLECLWNLIISFNLYNQNILHICYKIFFKMVWDFILYNQNSLQIYYKF